MKKKALKFEGFKKWCLQESNQGHTDFQSVALPTELRHQLKERQKYKNFICLNIFLIISLCLPIRNFSLDVCYPRKALIFTVFKTRFLMRISYNWIKEIVDFNLSPEETSELLTDIGLEVEKSEIYESIKGGLNGIIVGEVKKVEQHPNADRLKITHVDIGEENWQQIICGAPNVALNQKVLVATPGTTIFPIGNEPLKIKKATIRGVESHGMICAEDEIGLSSNHDSIVVLPEKTAVGEAASTLYNVSSDTIYEIGLTPNRADAMSHYGVARDILAALKFQQKINPKQSLKPIDNNIEIKPKEKTSFSVEILEPKKCTRYTGIIIKNVTVKESPLWVKLKLESIGVKSINNIVDITNLVLHDLGQPLHAFDLDKITNEHIKVRCPKPKTRFITLDETERTLDQNDLMICNDTDEMCIAGVFGGIDSGVNEKTKHVFIESALFNPVNIRKTAKRHGLNTDASFRYERGVDPEMVIPALLKAASLMLDLSGGEIGSEIIDVNPNKNEGNFHKCEVNFESIRKLCGINASNDDMLDILKYLEISAEKSDHNLYMLTIPSYRVDVTRESDVAEEILRIYGYNNVIIPEKINSTPSFTPIKNTTAVEQKLSNYLTACGFNEIMNNSLTNAGYSNILNDTSFMESQYVKILNPLSSDTAVLRQSLVFNILEVIKYNQDHGESNIQVFEWGKTYKQINNQHQEEKQLTIALKGLQNDEHWFNGKQPTSFFQLKGFMENIFGMLGIKYKEEIFEEDNDVFSGGVIYTTGKNKMAKCGIINNDLCDAIGIKDTCYIAEIYWKEIYSLHLKNKVKFSHVNKFQKVYRDLSIQIDENVSLNDILKAVGEIKNQLLKNITLFDIYRDKKQLKDQKAYGLRFQFLHPERTLKDKEVDQLMGRIQENILKKTNGKLR